MRVFCLIPLVFGVSYAFPQDTPSCTTTTEDVLVPTSTVSYIFSDYITTVTATTPKDLGTYTEYTTLSSTATIHCFTTTATECTANGTITAGPTATMYTTSGAAPSTVSSSLSGYGSPPGYRRALGLAPRQDACTVTKTFIRYGVAYTSVTESSATSTEYSEYSLATVTSTASGGTAYAIGTATTTSSAICGPTSSATNSISKSTITQDVRCAPTSLVSAAGGTNQSEFGISYLGSNQGAVYIANSTDASACCQLCADAGDCAASAWDIRTGGCRLVFTAAYDTGAIRCGSQLVIAYYDAGPSSPTAPGSGLFVGDMCNTVGYYNAEPDDGT